GLGGCFGSVEAMGTRDRRRLGSSEGLAGLRKFRDDRPGCAILVSEHLIKTHWRLRLIGLRYVRSTNTPPPQRLDRHGRRGRGGGHVSPHGGRHRYPRAGLLQFVR